MPLNFLQAQKRLTKLPALCWAGHAGCGYGNLQQRWHHPWTDPAPVTSRYKNVTFLLYLDIEFRALTGLYVLKVFASLQVDWEGHTRNRTFMSSCSNLPIPHHPAFRVWATTTVHTTSSWLSACSPGVLWRVVYLPNTSKPNHQSF